MCADVSDYRRGSGHGEKSGGQGSGGAVHEHPQGTLQRAGELIVERRRSFSYGQNVNQTNYYWEKCMQEKVCNLK